MVTDNILLKYGSMQLKRQWKQCQILHKYANLVLEIPVCGYRDKMWEISRDINILQDFLSYSWLNQSRNIQESDFGKIKLNILVNEESLVQVYKYLWRLSKKLNVLLEFKNLHHSWAFPL